MSNSDQTSQKKKGLAKLAKARSISNSLNDLEFDSSHYTQNDSINCTENEEASSNSAENISLANAGQCYSVLGTKEESVHSSVQPSSVHSRYIRIDNANDNCSSLVQSEKKDDASNETSTVPSTTENIEKAKSDISKEEKVVGVSSKKSFIQSLNRKSFKKKKKDSKKDEKRNSRCSSPSKLQIPKQVSRSRSLSRLSDAISNVQQVCITPTQSALGIEATERSGKPAKWNTIDRSSLDYDSSDEYEYQAQESENSGDLSPRRWSSLGQLEEGENVHRVQVRMSEAKQKNYLFGGLGSLLGPTELKRYFPDRSVVILLATWNMNGKEPPSSLDDFLLPDDLEHMPDMFVIGTQESGGDRTEWEFLKKDITAYDLGRISKLKELLPLVSSFLELKCSS